MPKTKMPGRRVTDEPGRASKPACKLDSNAPFDSTAALRLVAAALPIGGGGFLVTPAVGHIKERPEHQDEVAIARTLVRLERTAPGFVTSIRRAMKMAEALLLVEHVRCELAGKVAA